MTDDHGVLETTLLLRCPHCQTRVEAPDDPSLVAIHCSVCKKKFQVVGPRAERELSQRVGRFELLERLGVGSFGAVWRARDSKLDRDVAIKVPRGRQLHSLEVEEVMREARMAGRLRHPHIVAIHEVGRDQDETPYIVSDLIRGISLDRWIQRHPPSFMAAANLCRMIAEALDHAHNEGVIHRDLKPANVLIDEQGEPHLTDFGLAKRADDEIAMTMDGHILGTPAYMSPEQARGKSHLCDRPSDVYSLGVILFQLLTNELPFRGNMSVLMHKIAHDDPPSPRQYNQYVPRDLETICLKCLRKEPSQRYPTAMALAEELQRFVRDEPIQARPLGPMSRLWRWSRRQPLVASLVVSTLVLLLLIAALTSWGFLRERNLRQELERTISSQRNLLAFIRHSDTIRRHWDAVEQAAREPLLHVALSHTRDDPEFREICRRLTDAALAQDGPALRQAVLSHPVRQELQKWLQQHYDQSNPQDVFAWFVQDDNGLQLARAPLDAQSIGQNYAWRSYFHGSQQDLRAGSDHRPERPVRHLSETHLSTDFRTEITDREVVAISTPILIDGHFSGVLGVFLYIIPPGELAPEPTLRETTSPSSGLPRRGRFLAVVGEPPRPQSRTISPLLWSVP